MESNFLLYGIIDDIWYDSHNKKNHLVIIKTTSKDETLNYDSIWPGYWRQLSFYSFLVQKNGIDTSKTGIFIYINTGKNLRILIMIIYHSILIYLKRFWILAGLNQQLWKFFKC